LKTVGYVSRAEVPIDRNEYEAIRAQSASHNRRFAITGVLLYKNEHFIQVLEGAAAVVDPLYGRIAADARHRILTKFLDASIRHRLFGMWSMGGNDDVSTLGWLGIVDKRLMALPENRYTAEQVDALRRLGAFLRNPTIALHGGAPGAGRGGAAHRHRSVS
jgi:hypothetical protein